MDKITHIMGFVQDLEGHRVLLLENRDHAGRLTGLILPAPREADDQACATALSAHCKDMLALPVDPSSWVLLGHFDLDQSTYAVYGAIADLNVARQSEAIRLRRPYWHEIQALARTVGLALGADRILPSLNRMAAQH